VLVVAETLAQDLQHAIGEDGRGEALEELLPGIALDTDAEVLDDVRLSRLQEGEELGGVDAEGAIEVLAAANDPIGVVAGKSALGDGGALLPDGLRTDTGEVAHDEQLEAGFAEVCWGHKLLSSSIRSCQRAGLAAI